MVTRVPVVILTEYRQMKHVFGGGLDPSIAVLQYVSIFRSVANYIFSIIYTALSAQVNTPLTLPAS